MPITPGELAEFFTAASQKTYMAKLYSEWGLMALRFLHGVSPINPALTRLGFFCLMLAPYQSGDRVK
jgi:hypothetical protein